MRALLAFLALTLATTILAQEVGETKRSASAKEFLPVKEAFQLEIESLEAGDLQLRWEIAETYYLYQHRFKFQLEDASGIVELAVQLPEGLAKTDEFFGDVVVHYREADILLTPSRAVGQASLEVTSQGCADAGLCYPPHKQYFNVDFSTGTVTPTAPPGPRGGATSTSEENRAADLSSLPYMLLLALLGGAILNLMPCVFPILSLKVLSFANSTDNDRHLHSWVYTAGVVLSFVLIAAVLIALQHAGQAIGWDR